MKILISEITDEGLDLKIDEQIDTGAVKLTSPAVGTLSVRKVGSELVVEGDIKLSALFECSRCLNEYNAEIAVPVNVIYQPVSEYRVEGKHEVREDELDTGFYAGDEFDVLEMVKEQVLLNIPMKSLCSETCRGLCQVCGKDLNVSACSCSIEKIDPRLEKLKQLLRRE